jgi:16S rRNA G527 N7-methylase RsmG
LIEALPDGAGFIQILDSRLQLSPVQASSNRIERLKWSQRLAKALVERAVKRYTAVNDRMGEILL